jgi:hypothetical protein
MFRMRLVLPALILMTIPLLAQQAPVDTKEVASDAGVESVFRNPHPPLGRLTFRQAGMGELHGRKLVRYSVSVSGVSGAGPYILMTWDIGTNAPVNAVRDVKLDAQGRIRCGNAATDCAGAAPGAELVVGLTGMTGQPRRFILTGKDKKPIAMGEVVPFPAFGGDQNCTIEAVLIRPDASATLVIGRGFQPNEAVKFLSSSYDESVNSTKTADKNGETVSVVLPYVKGHSEGETKIKLVGARCQPGTEFRWGTYREEAASPAAKK